ncbi:PTS sugar transporter subunit IIA [Holdemania sp. Marseille-P2844]|uniref:PTS sugar transporter subunit IIA n=1 Tax=unclassified Holdemania TaxID=2637685 RepID=UPI0009323D3A|nr:PTS sugar transporter subunit IIA [Holdemania sp. Marseille-P2844]
MKYLIASHGEYAAGLTSAVCRLAGENPDVTALCAYTDETPLETRMQKIMEGHEAETWIIMTDLLGGSVNQYMMRSLLKPNCHILAGVNLELILNVLKLEETDDLAADLQRCVSEAQSRICYVNSFIQKKGSES